ncbi:hypothetical protein BLAHAN_06133 [Blautia hansenii DSM 20583]|uniref:Uncharacterized protein n=1 Tax=Blautia hansenii DSM 20583 TaxID=537007 RepID=C9L9P9_BLAHA|nr:hypothetical protein BLAHAN_06133 [Blautia hansenii DSM 20583]
MRRSPLFFSMSMRKGCRIFGGYKKKSKKIIFIVRRPSKLFHERYLYS